MPGNIGVLFSLDGMLLLVPIFWILRAVRAGATSSNALWLSGKGHGKRDK